MERRPQLLYKYVGQDRLLKFLENPSLRFTPLTALNDPFEGRPLIVGHDELGQESEVRTLNDDTFGVFSQFSTQLSFRLGVCSLTYDPKSILMWAYYGEDHRGGIIGFDIQHEFFKELDIFDVLYSADPPTLKTEELVAAGFNYLNPTSMNWNTFIKKRIDIIITKSDHWSHEREARAILEFNKASFLQENDSGFFMGATRKAASIDSAMQRQIISVPPEAINQIILGAKHQLSFSSEGLELLSDSNIGLEERVRARIENNSDLSHLRVLRASINYGGYSVSVSDPLNPAEAARFLHPQEVALYAEGFKGTGHSALSEALRARTCHGQ